MKRGKLHVRDDEEPDRDESYLVPLDQYLDAVRGLCSFCGQEGHRAGKCPNRPKPY